MLINQLIWLNSQWTVGCIYWLQKTGIERNRINNTIIEWSKQKKKNNNNKKDNKNRKSKKKRRENVFEKTRHWHANQGTDAIESGPST